MSTFKAFIAHLWASVSLFWHNLLPKVKQDSQMAISILDKVKAGETYLDLIKGVAPDVVAKIDEVINTVLAKSIYINGYVQGMDPDSILNSVRATIDKATAAGDIHRNTTLDGISKLFLDTFNDGKLDWADLVPLGKFVFDLIHKPA